MSIKQNKKRIPNLIHRPQNLGYKKRASDIKADIAVPDLALFVRPFNPRGDYSGNTAETCKGENDKSKNKDSAIVTSAGFAGGRVPRKKRTLN